MEREEAEDLIKRHGGRVTGSVSKKTVVPNFILNLIGFRRLITLSFLQNYLLCDEDIGGAKSTKAKELGFAIFDPCSQTIVFESYISSLMTGSNFSFVALPSLQRMDCLT